MQSIRLLVLAGGRSREHQVSIASAKSVLAALNNSPIETSVLVISKQGHWLNLTESTHALEVGYADSGGSALTTGEALKSFEYFDIIFPLVHGTYGEDGTLQGLLEIASVPYIGSGVLGSALCMDKAMSKDVLKCHGIPQVNYLLITKEIYQAQTRKSLQNITQNLSTPWFVKPANTGSSVGVSKVTDANHLQQAIDNAFKYDRRVVIEEGIEHVRELEVAMLGNDAPQASPVGEITYTRDFYDYTAKYTPGLATLHLPADINMDIAEKIQTLAKRTYRLLNCAGFARVDIFYQTSTGNIFLNEVNTLPGFTPLSMFPKLWELAGMNYSALILKLIELAQERYRDKSSML